MTPERLALLQQLVANHTFDWTYNDIRRIREPVDFAPRWGTKNVFDLPRVHWIYCTLRKDKVALYDTCGLPLTPHFEIAWVEAEGVVIVAHAFDDDGDPVAEDMIGMQCPLWRAEQATRKKRA